MTRAARGFVPVLHAATDTREDERDTLHAADSVQDALERLGYASRVIALSSDLTAVAALAAMRPRVVFNLVEALFGDDALAHIVPSLLEHHGLGHTGGDTHSLALTRSKCVVKRFLAAAGIATPLWSVDGIDCNPRDRWIIKADRLHGSLGIDPSSVVSGEHAAGEILAREARHGTRFFAERYIDGREFNVALLSDGETVRVLPIQETRFEHFAPDAPCIVDYAAKWDPESPVYAGTVRHFGIERAEPVLAEELVRLARACWSALALTGYARIDLRTDRSDRPQVLEVNVNPAITPDAGFAAAAAEAGLDYPALIERLVLGAERRSRPSPTPMSTLPGTIARPRIAIGERHPADRADECARVAARSAHDGERRVRWRECVRAADVERVRVLLATTGRFNAEEIAIAAELVEAGLAQGAASGYEFVLAERPGRLLGYACYGRIDGTAGSFDLYWIAVDPGEQGQGLGRRILERAEGNMCRSGAERIYVDTSSSASYAATRAFYVATGYVEQARLRDYYRCGDDKIVYAKTLARW